MEGPFSFSEAPAEYLDFLRKKRRQIAGVAVQYGIAGAVGALAVSLARGEPMSSLPGVMTGVLMTSTLLSGMLVYGLCFGGLRRSF